VRDPLRLLDECHRRYGDTFTLDAARVGRFVMLSDPEAVRQVFRGDPEVLHGRSGQANRAFTAMLGRNSRWSYVPAGSPIPTSP
jgi:cytochrome P450